MAINKQNKNATQKVSETLAGRYNHDKDILARIDAVVEKGNRPFREIMDAFPAYIRRYNLTRFLAHYELFRMIKDIPGSIVECGVYRGASLFAFGKFLEIFCMGDKARKAYGFDNFRGFTDLDPKDGPIDTGASREAGGWNPEDFRDEFMELLDIFHKDAFAPWADRIIMIEGDVLETIPTFVEKHPGLRISLLHLDIDLYKPTLTALENFYPRVVNGGLVVLDEYALINWGGESTAVEEYFGGKIPKLHTFSWVGNPNCYFIKGEE